MKVVTKSIEAPATGEAIARELQAQMNYESSCSSSHVLISHSTVRSESGKWVELIMVFGYR